jgi:hypothetical protein
MTGLLQWEGTVFARRRDEKASRCRRMPLRHLEFPD